MAQERPTRRPSDRPSPGLLPAGLSPKVIVLGIMSMIFFSIIISRVSRMVVGTKFFGNAYYSVGAFFLTIVFAMALSWLIMRMRERKLMPGSGPWFTPQETIAFFMIAVIAGSISTQGFFHRNFHEIYMLPVMAFENPDLAPWFNALPAFLYPQSTEAVVAFLEGGSMHVVAWMPGILTWTLFFGVLYFGYLCTATMVRRRWTDVERYQFPLTVPPLMLFKTASDGSPFGPIWRNRLAWMGASVGFVYVMYMELSTITPLWDTPTWQHNVTAGTPVNFTILVSPMMIGVAYAIVNLHILFSVWFFYLVYHQGLRLVMDSTGLAQTGQFGNAYMNQQFMGALVMLMVLSLWAARSDLRNIINRALNPSSSASEDEAYEPLSYPVAFWGLVGSALFVLLFMRYVLMMGFLIAGLLVFCLFTFALAEARMRAQAGVCVNVPFRLTRPHRELASVIGTEAIGVNNWVYGSYFGRISTQGFYTMMGHTLDAFRMGDTVDIPRRDMSKILLFAVVAGIFVFVWTVLLHDHAYGGLNTMDAWARRDEFPRAFALDPGANQIAPGNDMWILVFVGVGMLITGVLSFAYSAWTWFPLHPVGFAGGITDGTGSFLFFPFLVAWVVKSLVLRYGGASLQQRVLPFFIGMIMGYVIPKGFMVIIVNILNGERVWYI